MWLLTTCEAEDKEITILLVGEEEDMVAEETTVGKMHMETINNVNSFIVGRMECAHIQVRIAKHQPMDINLLLHFTTLWTEVKKVY